MTAPAFVSFRWFCCAGAVSSSRTQYIPTSGPCPVPPPPPDKVRPNEGAEFRSCLFLSHSDALCPKAGTGIGHGTVPEILSEPP